MTGEERSRLGRVGLLVYAPILLLLLLAAAVAQDPPHSYSWYSGDIAGEVDRARAAGVPLEPGKVQYLIDALRVNSERWSYIETQVMENLEIDLDMDLVQEPLQNLALAQLLLADLALQAGRAGEGLPAVQRGCSVHELVQPDETTPHPYSHRSLSKRCADLLEKYCPKQHPSMNGNEEQCRDAFESISSSRQLRQSLVEGKAQRALDSQQRESGAGAGAGAGSSDKKPVVAEAGAAAAAAPAGTKAGLPVDRRGYTELASALYDSDQLMRLYTPEAPSNNPLMPTAVAPSKASMVALYLCLGISLSITALLVNKRKQYSRRGGKSPHSLLSMKGITELGGQLIEAISTAAVDVPVLARAAGDSCALFFSELKLMLKGRGSAPAPTPAARAGKTSGKDIGIQKNVSTKKGGNSTASSGKNALSNSSSSKLARVGSHSNSNISSSSIGDTATAKAVADTVEIKMQPPVETDAVLLDAGAAESPMQPLRADAVKDAPGTEAVPEREENPTENAVESTAEKSIAKIASFRKTPEVDTAEMDFGDNSSLSSLTMGPDGEGRGRDTPSPVIPFIADYEDELRLEAAAAAVVKSPPARPQQKEDMPWPRDFKLFSPTVTDRKSSVASFGHPTISGPSPGGDNDSVGSLRSTNSWMGIDGQVYSDHSTSLNEAARLGSARTDQDMHLYNYWGGGSAVSVTSVESSINPKAFRGSLSALSQEFISAEALTDSSPVLSERSMLFPGSQQPISPPRKLQQTAPSLLIDTSFFEQSTQPASSTTRGPGTGVSRGPGTGNSRGPSSGYSGISRTFSDDDDFQLSYSKSKDRADEVSAPAGSLPIAPTLFGPAGPSARPRPPLHHAPTKAAASRAPPPGFEDCPVESEVKPYFGPGADIIGPKDPIDFNRPAEDSGNSMLRRFPPNKGHSRGRSRPYAQKVSPPEKKAVSKTGGESDTIVLQVIGL